MGAVVRQLAHGIAFGVRVTPKSARDAIDGTWTGADGRTYIKVRVTAPPHEGEANAAVAALIAKSLGVPKGHVEIVRGGGAREKVVEVAGDAADLAARLNGLIAKSKGGS